MNAISSEEDKNMLKKEKELSQNKNHSNRIKMYITARRTTNDNSLIKNQGSNIRYRYKRYSLPSDIEDLNIDIIKVIDNIKASIEELKTNLKFSFNKEWNINDALKENLKRIK